MSGKESIEAVVWEKIRCLFLCGRKKKTVFVKEEIKKQLLFGEK